MRPRHITPRDYPEWRNADSGHRQAGAQRALCRLPGHGDFLDAVDEHILALRLWPAQRAEPDTKMLTPACELHR